MRILVAGCGYVGLRAGKLLRAQGHQVFGIRRSSAGLQEVAASGLEPTHFDLVTWEGQALPNVDAILHTASSARGGPEAYRQIYVEGTTNLARWGEETGVRYFLYTSSTGVYSQTDGSWVTEESPATPNSENSEILLKAEELIRDSKLNSAIFRVAGIYGPQRGYHLKQFLAGKAAIGKTAKIINMVHVEDVAAVLTAAISQNKEGLYNLVDCKPVTDHELYAWLSNRLGGTVEVQEEPSTRTRPATNKRVSNARLLKDFCYKFIYPTFKEGFEAELQK